MKTVEDIERLEKVMGQLKSAYTEISILAKKTPNDALNLFKLKLINSVIESANLVLGDKYKPLGEFDQFDSDDVPTNSDVTVVLALYMKEIERFRSDNVKQDFDSKWKYVLNNSTSDFEAARPTKVGE